MRLLIACPRCQRQFDATGRSAGSRFRCLCGEVVTVQPPKGRDASVVRCSACGGPREAHQASCQFCGADFTLHERDLDTVCPKCLARVSDRAKFCHHCGTKLMPEPIAADATELACPACGPPHHLADRRIGQISVLECGRCAGFWLAGETFKQLTERASSEAIDVDQLLGSAGVHPAQPAEAGEEPARWRYRKCPSCGRMMHRRNYGHQSGVIVDVCKDHGVWFDADELPRILNWIRSGQKAKAEEQRAAEEARQERIRQRTRAETGRGGAMGTPFGGADGSRGGGFLDEICEWLFGLP
jgi:Zn-finger nucleic acid-binding protein